MMRRSVWWLALLLVAPCAFGEAPTRRIELRILDSLGRPAVAERVNVFTRDGRTAEARQALLTDENGFVTVFTNSDEIRVEVPSLTPFWRLLQLPDDDSGGRWEFSPSAWSGREERRAPPSHVITTARSGASSITFTIDCWNDAFPAGYGNNCDFCTNTIQPNHQFTYACNGGAQGPWTPNCAFQSPIPTGNLVTKVEATVINQNCTAQSSSGTVLAYSIKLNGIFIGSPFTTTQQNCSCTAGCHQDLFTTGDFPDGIPGYVDGGANIFTIDVAQGIICVQNVLLTLTYAEAGKRLQITDVTDAIIPTNSGLVNGCPEYRSTLTVRATDGGNPARSISPTLKSSRNDIATPDTFNQPGQTDQSGTTTGTVTTRKRGVANFTATANGYRPSPEYAKAFGDADYENTFLITGYGIALETDFTGATVTDPCGLQGTFNQDFLYSNRGVLMEGSGQAANGTIITIDYNVTPRPNRNRVCFTTDTCARTSSGACAQIGTTIAVDRDVVPMGASVNIDTIGLRTAQDVGNRIRGEHIDVFAGAGRTVIDAIGSNNRRVRYISGGGQCD